MSNLDVVLWYAARRNLFSDISSLLKEYPEINVNGRDDNEWTALHMASHHGYVEVVILLLAHSNINVNVKNDLGDTPFF